MYVFALASIIFNVFIFCYIGDLLTERCQMVGTTCYETEWYRMPPKKAIEFIMPITMARYPIAITAGKMMTMTLSTFSDVSNVGWRFTQNTINISKHGSFKFRTDYVSLLTIDVSLSLSMSCVTIAVRYFVNLCKVFE